MNNNNKNIFLPDGCLTQYAIEAYVHQKLSAQEIRLVEMHISNCELCGDAIEGAMMQMDKTLINPANDHTRLKYYRKPLIAAASLLALVGASYFLFTGRNLQKSLVRTETKKLPTTTQSATITNSTDSVITPKSNSIEINNTAATDNLEPQKIGSTKEPARKETELQTDLIPTVSVAPTTNSNVAVTLERDDNTEASLVKATDTLNSITTNANTAVPAPAGQPSIATNTSGNLNNESLAQLDQLNNVSNTRSEGRSGPSRKAKSLRVQVPASSSSNNDAFSNKNEEPNENISITRALALYNNGQYSDAITILKAIKQNKQNRDEINYQLALCYLKLNKNAEATEILNNLAKGKSKYAALAQQLLEEN